MIARFMVSSLELLTPFIRIVRATATPPAEATPFRLAGRG